MNASEAVDMTVEPMGHINPHTKPLTQKDVFTRDSHSVSGSTEKEKGMSIEVEPETEKPEAQPPNFIEDPYRPFDDLPDEAHWVLTIRAVFVGVCCGALVNASNVYLGLKTGWTFTANLFGAIAGFAVIKFFSKTFAENFPILGGNFGPRENNIIQTAATAAGGMSNVFVSAFPAMYQLGLLRTPKEDFMHIVGLTAVGGFFGFFFATPLRKFFIIYVARELNLIFPTPSATALTIRSMHEAVTGAAIANVKMRALSIAFSAALVLRVVSQYAIGILWDWHIFTWFFIWGNYHNLAINVENWGWMIEWTPAFIGAGMLVGLNVAISFYGGSILAWGIIGPALVHSGVAVGIPAGPEDDPRWDNYISFYSLSAKYSTKDTFSPRFWLLWPGVLCMIAVSFTELALQWKIILYAFQALSRAGAKAMADLTAKMGKDYPILHRLGQPKENVDGVKDPAPEEDQVKVWMWLPGLTLSIICICVVLGVVYSMPVSMSVLSIFLAFFFSFLAIQCTGVTDITPLTAASKASQIILGGATKGEGWGTYHSQQLNLLGGALANIGANQATDLVSDFRVGFLLRTPPKQQFLAQGLGTIVAVFLAPAMFVLFMQAYPCIIDLEAETCAFSAPSVSAWRAVAVAVTDPVFPVPTSSGIFAIVFAVLGSVMVFVRHYVWVGRLEWVRAYHPNMMCVALAFVVPQTYYGLAMLMGATLAFVWAKRNPGSFDTLGYAIAAGFIAGEGIGGVINAIFQVAGISGDKYGTNVACPGNAC